MSTAGETIKCRAAVTWSPGSDFKVEEIYVAPPQPGEIRMRILYSSLCATDATFWKAPTPFPLPIILGHEASGVIESVGDGVIDLQPGDCVICLVLMECQKCDLCKCPKTNMCEIGASSMMGGFLPNDTKKTRFTSLDGQAIHHFTNCSTFTEYSVMPEGSVAKVSPAFPLNKSCLLSCGVPTGWGSVWNIAKVDAGSTVAVIGLGTVGLAVIEAAKIAGASRIIAVDVEPRKFELAKKFGATDCLNSNDHEMPIEKVVHELVKGGVDYSFECVGNTKVMLSALECCSQYGTAVIVGVAKFTDLISFSPWLLLFGRQWKSGSFGGYKGKSQTQSLVDMCMRKEVDLDRYITHRLPFSKIAEGFELQKTGSCVKCIFHMNDIVD